MGVDISLFAKLTMIRLDLDRAWMFSAWDTENIRQLEVSFKDSAIGLDLESTLYYLNECLNVNSKSEDRDQDRKDYAKYWIDRAIEFVTNRPNDIFFMITDHEDKYFDLCDEYSNVNPTIRDI